MLTGGYWDELPLPGFFETATTAPFVLSKLFETYPSCMEPSKTYT